MDKTFFLSHRTTMALQNSVECLNDEKLFGPLDADDRALLDEADEVFGGDAADAASRCV